MSGLEDCGGTVICQICRGVFKTLESHLHRKHGLGCARYRCMFPGAETSSRDFRARKGQTLKGKKLTLETRSKISQGNKGKSMPREVVERVSAALRGRVGEKHTLEHRKKNSQAQRGRKNALGKKRTLEQRGRNSQAQIEWWKAHPERKMYQAQIGAKVIAKFHQCNPSPIERLVQEALIVLKIPWQAQVREGRYVIDLVLPDKVAIEVDGCLFHKRNCPVCGVRGSNARDNDKDTYLTSVGYRVFRISSCEIRLHFRQRLTEILNSAYFCGRSGENELSVCG